MTCDVVLAGVGGQGVLSMAALIGRAALSEGFEAKQSEVHGMAQRGGAVLAHLRLSDRPIASDLIPMGRADLVLSLEPLEALRHVEHLAPTGTVVTATGALENIPNYPAAESLKARFEALPHVVQVDATALAAEAGDPQTINTVMVGAAARLLPLRLPSLERAITEAFERKGERVLRANLAAFAAGRRAAG
jgi:indolepyruvate ferredoxin oxidoreductase beta subunit